MNAPEASAEERIVPGTPHWDSSYPDHIQRYCFAASIMTPGSRVLDAGCGVGYGSAELVDRGAARVVAVDISHDALELARHHFDRPNITWCRDDCHELTHARDYAPFDAVLNFENIEHLAEPERFVARAAALLHRDGALITSTPNRLLLNRLRGVSPDAPSTNPHHLNEFSEDEFRALLSRHFGEVQLWYQSPTGSDGMQLRLRAMAGALGLIPLLRRIRQLMRRRAVGTGGTQTARGFHEWRIDARRSLMAPAWTIIAVCRRPRSPHSAS